jgi:hypothetical protein
MKWTKQRIAFFLLSVPLFVVFFIPNIIASNQSHGKDISHLITYISNEYHGIHLRRILQVFPDTLIEFKEIFAYKILNPVAYSILPAYLAFLLWNKQKFTFLITFFWFAVPLIIFSAYRGEISNYYYTLLRPIAVLIVAFLLSRIYSRRRVGKTIVLSFLFFIFLFNIQKFLTTKHPTVPNMRQQALIALEHGVHIPFVQGDGVSYLYYYYKYKRDGAW